MGVEEGPPFWWDLMEGGGGGASPTTNAGCLPTAGPPHQGPKGTGGGGAGHSHTPAVQSTGGDGRAPHPKTRAMCVGGGVPLGLEAPVGRQGGGRSVPTAAAEGDGTARGFEPPPPPPSPQTTPHNARALPPHIAGTGGPCARGRGASPVHGAEAGARDSLSDDMPPCPRQSDAAPGPDVCHPPGPFGRGGMCPGTAAPRPRVTGLPVQRLGGGGVQRLNPPPPCDSPSGCCSFTGPWTVTRSSLRMLRRVAAFCRPLRPVLLLVSFPCSRSPVAHRRGTRTRDATLPECTDDMRRASGHTPPPPRDGGMWALNADRCPAKARGCTAPKRPTKGLCRGIAIGPPSPCHKKSPVPLGWAANDVPQAAAVGGGGETRQRITAHGNAPGGVWGGAGDPPPRGRWGSGRGVRRPVPLRGTGATTPEQRPLQ